MERMAILIKEENSIITGKGLVWGEKKKMDVIEIVSLVIVISVCHTGSW